MIPNDQSLLRVWEAGADEEVSGSGTHEIPPDFFVGHDRELEIRGAIITRADGIWDAHPAHIGFRRRDQILRIDDRPLQAVRQDWYTNHVYQRVNQPSRGVLVGDWASRAPSGAASADAPQLAADHLSIVKQILGDGRAHTVSVRHVGYERRMGMDGNYKGYQQFKERYGEAQAEAAWEKAKLRRGAGCPAGDSPAGDSKKTNLPRTEGSTKQTASSSAPFSAAVTVDGSPDALQSAAPLIRRSGGEAARL